MYNFLIKRGLSVALVLAALLSIVSALMYSGVEGDLDKYNPAALDATSFGLVSCYVLGIACAILALFLPLINSLMTDPKKLIGPLAGIGILAVIYFIGYGMADSAVTPKQLETFGTTAGISQGVGGSLIAMYILFFMTVAAAIFSAVWKMIK